MGFTVKDWADYEDPGAPRMDFVFTVGENAAAEVCPVWPGHPMTAHCGVADLADVERDALAKKAAFHRAFAELQNRISKFVRLRFESLDRFKLQKKLDEIGQTSPADSRDPAA